MTDELHNHIAEMVCETDAPGKPADVMAALEGVTALVAEYRARVETFDGLTAIMGELRTERGKPMRGLHQMTAEKLEALAAALAEQTARAEAAGALVRDLLEGYGASYIDSETWEKVTTEAKAFLALAAQEGGE